VDDLRARVKRITPGALEHLDKFSIGAFSEPLWIEIQVNIQCTHVRRIGTPQEQVGDGTAHHDYRAPIRTQNLPRFDQHGVHRTVDEYAVILGDGHRDVRTPRCVLKREALAEGRQTDLVGGEKGSGLDFSGL
jgi:hypothetical protein